MDSSSYSPPKRPIGVNYTYMCEQNDEIPDSNNALIIPNHVDRWFNKENTSNRTLYHLNVMIKKKKKWGQEQDWSLPQPLHVILTPICLNAAWTLYRKA